MDSNQKEMKRWYSLSERYPKVQGRYLIYGKPMGESITNVQYVASFDGSTFFSLGRFMEVSHWKRLDNDPK